MNLAPSSRGEPSARDAGAPKYSAASFIDAMRQSALGRWMTYLGTASEVDEAFGFAPADASEPYYSALSTLANDLVNTLAGERRAPVAVLDVGAGVGRVAFDVACANVVDRVVALERSAALVQEIEQLAAGTEREVSVPVTATKALRALLRPPCRAPKLRAVQGDAHRLPFEAAQFPLVLGFGVLDRVERPLDVAGEFARVVTPGGFAIVSCLHDFAGGPARAGDWLGSAVDAFVGPAWAAATPRRQRLDLRQNAQYVERFNAEVVVARRA